MTQVLFSAIGSHDPFSTDGSEGAMLHIIRHYSPDVVYMFFTQEMLAKKKSCQAAIKAQSPHATIQTIETNIENAADFDAFHNEFSQIFTQIRSNYPTADILLNITSGTGQMTMALCAEVLSHREKLTPIQVDNPKYNKSSNRSKEPQLLGLRKRVLTRQIKYMVKMGDYTGAYYLLKQSPGIFATRLKALLNHAHLRSTENENAESVASEHLQDIYINLYPPVKGQGIKPADAIKAMNYFQMLTLKQSRSEITDFTLRANSFAEYLVEKDINLKTFAKKAGGRGGWLIKMEKLETNYPALLQMLKTKNIDFSKELNAKSFLLIAKFFGRKEYGILFNNEFRDFRNKSTHVAAATTEQNLQKSLGFGSLQILNAIRTCLERIFTPPPEFFNIFAFIDKEISNELHK